MAMRHSESTGLTFDGRLPCRFARDRVEADYFALAADDERLSRENHRRVVRRGRAPLPPFVRKSGALLLQGGELILLLLIIHALGLVTLARGGERLLSFLQGILGDRKSTRLNS